MFEMIGLLFGLSILCGIALAAGGAFAGIAWLLFWGRRRPKLLVLAAGLIPISALAYVIFCAICMEIFVPNQPDLFFGDFAEPVPNGYVLTGLGKMPEFSYFESTPPMNHQPPLLGGVRRLELDGEIVYGAYGHIETEPYDGENKDRGYFRFDTRSGQVKNFNTIEELNISAGRSVHLVESQLFRSPLPSRVILRRVENSIFVVPPLLVAFLYFCFLLRHRVQQQQ
jgi:hypothetical protein